MLGPFEVRGAPGGEVLARDRERALLSALALELDRVVSHDALCEALWPSDDASHAGGLKTYVMRLRRVVGTDAIQTTTRGYRLSSVDVTRDADAFEHAVARVAPGADPLPSNERITLLEAALARWRGRPYDELGEWPPAVLERMRLDELRQLGFEARSDAELELGIASIATLELLVAEQPLRERRWQQLMIGLYRSGRQAEALRAFERARVLLRDQLGIDPGMDLAYLERAILRHDPALDLRPSGAIIPVAPSPGTEARSDDARLRPADHRPGGRRRDRGGPAAAPIRPPRRRLGHVLRRSRARTGDRRHGPAAALRHRRLRGGMELRARPACRARRTARGGGPHPRELLADAGPGAGEAHRGEELPRADRRGPGAGRGGARRWPASPPIARPSPSRSRPPSSSSRTRPRSTGAKRGWTSSRI